MCQREVHVPDFPCLTVALPAVEKWKHGPPLTVFLIAIWRTQWDLLKKPIRSMKFTRKETFHSKTGFQCSYNGESINAQRSVQVCYRLVTGSICSVKIKKKTRQWSKCCLMAADTWVQLFPPLFPIWKSLFNT